MVNKVDPGDPTTWTLTTPGKGLCGLVDRRNASSDAHAYYVNNVPDDLCPGPNCPASDPAWDWESFDGLMDGARSLMADDGPNGDTYYVMNDVVSLLDKFLSRVSVSQAEISGLLHTVGILMAEYDSGSSTWVYSDDLANIMSVYLPDIMDTFTGNYDNLMIIAYNLFKPGGFMESLLTGLKTSYPWSQIFTDLNDHAERSVLHRPVRGPEPLDRGHKPGTAPGGHGGPPGQGLVHAHDLLRPRLQRHGR